LEPLKKKHPEISWADLIAFVGVVAIETMGGPQINFSYGRVDEMDPAKVTPDGRLPDADKGDGPGPKTRKGLRDVFARMGFGDREIVALSGAHALGRCHAGTYLYFPYPGTLFAHTRLTLFVHNHRRVRVRRPVVRHAFAFQQLVLRASERA
jgi:cytochrome c peroxidase